MHPESCVCSIIQVPDLPWVWNLYLWLATNQGINFKFSMSILVLLIILTQPKDNEIKVWTSSCLAKHVNIYDCSSKTINPPYQTTFFVEDSGGFIEVLYEYISWTIPAPGDGHHTWKLLRGDGCQIKHILPKWLSFTKPFGCFQK